MGGYPDSEPIDFYAIWIILAAAVAGLFLIAILRARDPNRRWPRFSLRGLFMAMTVLGVWFGWQVSIVQSRHTMRREIEASGGEFLPSLGGNIQQEREGDFEYATPVIRWLLGDSRTYIIYFGRVTTSDDLRRAEAFPEADVYGWSHPGR